MKVLITGAQSYVGESVARYIKQKEPTWEVTQLDVKGNEWKQYDFSTTNAVFHVAGIAHIKTTKENEHLYYLVNRDLAYEVASKAKSGGVAHFIFMSSMSVYSDKCTYVNNNTATSPDSVYGDSKLQAEKILESLSDNSFIVSILRPPMIYGAGCKGNYNGLRRLSLLMPFFPRVKNKRSMLYIDNLAEFVYQLVKKPQNGLFFPQNEELVNTSSWAKLIAKENGKNLRLSSLLGLCAIAGKHVPFIKKYCIKAFGDSYYDQKMSLYDDYNYQVVSFEDSISMTEKNY